VLTGGEFPRFVVSVDTLEGGRTVVNVWSDNHDAVDELLEAAGVKMRFSIPHDMSVGTVTPELALQLLQQVLGTEAKHKRTLTDKQRAARAANAAKATEARRHIKA